MHALVPDTRGSLELTAIDKRPIDGRVPVGPLGVEGDDQFDKAHHGGVDQAVYAYAREDAQWWAAQLGYDIAFGGFGENLSTSGVDVTGAVLGEHWRVGDDGLLLEVTSPRVPCVTFQGWMHEEQWVRRFTERGAPGAYLRVLQVGTVAAGDTVEVVHRPGHALTVGEALVLRSADEQRLRDALDEGLRASMAGRIRRDLAARAQVR